MKNKVVTSDQSLGVVGVWEFLCLDVFGVWGGTERWRNDLLWLEERCWMNVSHLSGFTAHSSLESLIYYLVFFPFYFALFLHVICHLYCFPSFLLSVLHQLLFSSAALSIISVYTFTLVCRSIVTSSLRTVHQTHHEKNMRSTTLFIQFLLQSLFSNIEICWNLHLPLVFSFTTSETLHKTENNKNRLWWDSSLAGIKWRTHTDLRLKHFKSDLNKNWHGTERVFKVYNITVQLSCMKINSAELNVRATALERSSGECRQGM